MVVQSSQMKLKDLGVNLDPNLSFEEHIKTVSRTAFFHLRNIAKSETFCPKMQKNVSMLLLLLVLTTAMFYFPATRIKH